MSKVGHRIKRRKKARQETRGSPYEETETLSHFRSSAMTEMWSEMDSKDHNGKDITACKRAHDRLVLKNRALASV